MTAVIVLLVLLLLLALCYFAATFFFRYTFLRAEKPDPWGEEEGVIKNRAFFERPDRRLLEIESRDGLKLRALLYDRGAPVTVLLCHGYRGGPEELSGIAAGLYERGMNVVLIYQRAHGKSEGEYFTMGHREKQDVADWANRLAVLRPEDQLVLFGWSMGGNSVMGAVGEKLPENVVCAVEDCGYESLRDQLLYSCAGAMPRLPAKGFFVDLLGLYCRLFKGFPVREQRADALGRCRVPMLFIHGGRDNVVPYDNLERCYTECAAKKLRSSYARGTHVGSCGSEPERYFDELCGFIHQNTEGSQCTST